MSERRWAIVIQNRDGEAPNVFGPFKNEQEARTFEDRHVDAPEGARAWIVPQWSQP